jgi:glucose/arabinose dehydrogenase
MMASAEDGTVYVTRRGSHDMVALKDKDGDGKSDETKVVAKDLEHVHEIALRGDQVFLAVPAKILLAERSPDVALSAPKVIADGLPQWRPAFLADIGHRKMKGHEAESFAVIILP